MLILCVDPCCKRESLLREKFFSGVYDCYLHVLQDGKVIKGFPHMAATEQHKMRFRRDEL